MSPDRVIFSFVLGWVILVALLLALDWLGDPNRGMFRPKGERQPVDRESRKATRDRRKLEDDASVRAALRDAYGASSLRLNWTGHQEAEVRRLDDSLVVEGQPDALDVGSHEIDRTLIADDPLPNLVTTPAEVENEPSRDTVEDTADDETETKPTGWRVGDDPLIPTAKGDEPAAGTVRGRVWKNHATSDGWGKDNQTLMASGKAPRRRNPVTGDDERAIVDVKSGRASWGRDPIDPFEAGE